MTEFKLGRLVENYFSEMRKTEIELSDIVDNLNVEYLKEDDIRPILDRMSNRCIRFLGLMESVEIFKPENKQLIETLSASHKELWKIFHRTRNYVMEKIHADS